MYPKTPSPVPRGPSAIGQSAGMPADQFGRSIDSTGSPPPGGGGAAAKLQFPFQLQDTSPDAMTPTVNVRYGTFMDVEPTAVATDIALTDASTNYCYLHVTVDINGVMTAVELIVDTSPQPANGDYDGYITLGNAVVASDLITALNQAATHSLRFAMCGRVVTDGSLTTAGTFEFWGF